MATLKKKLCWNCEGRVSLEEENCPYCAVYIGPAVDEKKEQKRSFNPPYRVVDTEDQAPPASPYGKEEPEEHKETDALDLSIAKNDFKKTVFPLILFSSGTLFLLFGFVLWIFSEQGSLTLSWSSEYWYAYILSALVMLFIGWRSMHKFAL